MNDTPRLIEYAFPLKQTSLDSVHEKNVRHGHISTLHIWPARRPLAACRAALIATLLPDPSTQPRPEGMSDDEWHKEIRRHRKELCEKIGGKVVKKTERKKMPSGETIEREKEITEGGILHWGQETENKELLEWFRQEIRKAYNGRAPKVLDPFAGGGAIPLEAMRLGCEATAADINPVAWFILKCTLEYPQKLAGKTHHLPEFIVENKEFMDAFYRAHPHLIDQTLPTKRQLKTQEPPLWQEQRGETDRAPEADLAWHVRAWGQWVLDRARRELAEFYPTYADFEPLDKRNPKPYEKQPLRLVPLKGDGTLDIDAANSEFDNEYLEDKRNPRWVAKPTVAYLWARTVTCKNCRAVVPLLKTRWLCKKDKKRVLLTMEPNAEKTGVVFGIETGVPVKGGNTAQCREHDKQLGAGTMSRSGAQCPCCGTIMSMEDIRLQGQGGGLSAVNTAVVADGQRGKEYRLPTEEDIKAAHHAEDEVAVPFERIPDGVPDDPTPPYDALGNSIRRYGMTGWIDLFTHRQLLSLGMFCVRTRDAKEELGKTGYAPEWADAIAAYLALAVDRLADASSTIAHWASGGEFNVNTFQRFALSMSWDFSEVNPMAGLTGSYAGQISWITLALVHFLGAEVDSPTSNVIKQSATQLKHGQFDLVITDPPYYGAIPYSDTMDFFYVWLRRTTLGIVSGLDDAFNSRLGPKWDTAALDGELVDDPSRHGGNAQLSKRAYEDGMARAFTACSDALTAEGRLVVAFANKDPVAWETLVTALVRAGFVVDASWPIQTERLARTRSIGAAALASSVWLVCKKRSAAALAGWDNQVLDEMRRNIRERLREFWDAGIRGPDFVWAATGPALEAYSKHPVVKKANEPGPMTVNEFLTHVRRMVVDFVVGRVLAGEKEGGEELAAAERLDAPSAYYLLHRHDFGLDEAPAGACILYAISCGLSDRDLADTWNLIAFTKGQTTGDEEGQTADADAEADPDAEEDSGSKVKLKTWAQRKGRSLGYEAPGGKPVPLIDRVHCLMHTWKSGDLAKVDDYLDSNGLRRQELFKRLLQSLIELSPHGSEERSLLESLSNHVGVRGARADSLQEEIKDEEGKWTEREKR